jgi:hypothetical protein
LPFGQEFPCFTSLLLKAEIIRAKKMPKKAIYNNSEVFEMVEIFIGGSLVEKRSVALYQKHFI